MLLIRKPYTFVDFLRFLGRPKLIYHTSQTMLSVGSPHYLNYAHRAVVTLNNAGVSLLQRGMYDDAMKTLKDAAGVMRDTINSSKAGGDQADLQPVQSIWSEESLNRMVHRSWQLVARSTARCQTQTQQKEQPYHLLVTTQHDAATVWEELCERESFSQRRTVVSMNIEHVDFDTWGSDNNLDFDSSILIYNYGVANLCLSSHGITQNSLCARQQLLGNAFKLFQLAESLHSRLLKVLHENEDEAEGGECMLEDGNAVLLIASLLTRVLIQLSSQMGVSVTNDYDETHRMIIHMIANHVRCSSQVAAAA
jgi:hypothetical protein